MLLPVKCRSESEITIRAFSCESFYLYCHNWTRLFTYCLTRPSTMTSISLSVISNYQTFTKTSPPPILPRPFLWHIEHIPAITFSSENPLNMSSTDSQIADPSSPPTYTNPHKPLSIGAYLLGMPTSVLM